MFLSFSKKQWLSTNGKLIRNEMVLKVKIICTFFQLKEINQRIKFTKCYCLCGIRYQYQVKDVMWHIGIVYFLIVFQEELEMEHHKWSCLNRLVENCGESGFMIQSTLTLYSLSSQSYKRLVHHSLSCNNVWNTELSF